MNVSVKQYVGVVNISEEPIANHKGYVLELYDQ